MHQFGVPRELESALQSNTLSFDAGESTMYGVNTMRATEQGESPIHSFNMVVQSMVRIK